MPAAVTHWPSAEEVCRLLDTAESREGRLHALRTLAALQAHKDRQRFERDHLGADYDHGGLVICTHMGTPLAVAVVLPAFKRALSHADLPGTIRFHDLRHAAATIMLGHGVDVPPVAAVLGHARNSTTLDAYAHAVPVNRSNAVAAIQRAIRGAAAGTTSAV